jgi:hypothetical protein
MLMVLLLIESVAMLLIAHVFIMQEKQKVTLPVRVPGVSKCSAAEDGTNLKMSGHALPTRSTVDSPSDGPQHHSVRVHKGRVARVIDSSSSRKPIATIHVLPVLYLGISIPQQKKKHTPAETPPLSGGTTQTPPSRLHPTPHPPAPTTTVSHAPPPSPFLFFLAGISRSRRLRPVRLVSLSDPAIS